MREAKPMDVEAILNYLRPHVEDCIYMYIDIKKYGLNNSNINAWINDDKNGVNIVVMKYHTSISIYTRNDRWSVNDVVAIIRREKPLSVTATRPIVEILIEILEGEYEASYGSVFEFIDYRSIQFNGKIDRATEEDTYEIAELIKQDEDIGGYYEVDDLANQLAERMRTSMGRSYVIRDEGKIIAHIASYAECDHIATTGGLIVATEYQTGVYGAVLEGYLVEQLKKENFKVYTFVTARLRKLYLTAQGNPCVGEYGKMVLHDKAV